MEEHVEKVNNKRREVAEKNTMLKKKKKKQEENKKTKKEMFNRLRELNKEFQDIREQEKI